MVELQAVATKDIIESKQKVEVSVILTTCNRVEYFKQSVRSILDQDYDKFELIIVNDHPQTAKNIRLEFTILKLAYSNIQIQLIETLGAGVAHARNQGIKLSRGKYIALCDDDDVWTSKGKLTKQVDFLEEQQDVSIIGSCADIIDETGNVIGKRKVPIDDEDITRKMLFTCPFILSSIMFRKELGYFSESDEYNCVEDYEFYIRNLLDSRGKNFEESLIIQYRMHTGNITFNYGQKMSNQKYRLIRECGKDYPNYYLGLFLRSVMRFVPTNVKNYFRNIANNILT